MTDVRVDSADFHRLFLATRDADKVLYAQLRKAMRAIGKPLVDDVRSQIDGIPSGGGAGTGVRAALKAGTRVSISTSAKSAGLSLVTSPTRLPQAKRALAKAMNTPAFRHHVFGGSEWVSQAGNPYFGRVVGQHVPDMHRKIRAALDATADEIAGRI